MYLLFVNSKQYVEINSINIGHKSLNKELSK